MEEKLSYRDFVKQAILRLGEEGENVIHLERSGFRDAFFKYYGHDCQPILDELISQGFINTIDAENGVMVYLPSEVKRSKGLKVLRSKVSRAIFVVGVLITFLCFHFTDFAQRGGVDVDNLFGTFKREPLMILIYLGFIIGIPFILSIIIPATLNWIKSGE